MSQPGFQSDGGFQFAEDQGFQTQNVIAAPIWVWETGSPTEALTVTRAISIPLLVTVADNLPCTDLVTVAPIRLQLSVSDSIAVQESRTALIGALQVQVSDSWTPTESLSARTSALQVSVTDSPTPQETLTASLPLRLSVSDLSPITEAVTASSVATGPLLVTVSETRSIQEALTLALPLQVTVQDSPTVQEAVAFQFPPLSVTVSEDALPQEAVVGIPSLRVAVQDTVSGQEALTARLPALSVPVADTLAIEEHAMARVGAPSPVLVSVADGLVVTDLPTATVTPLCCQVQEVTTPQETLVLGFREARVIQVSDQASPQEGVTPLLPSLTVQVTDACTPLDPVSASLPLGVSVFSWVVYGDVPRVLLPMLPVQVQDSLTPSETLQAALPLRVSVSDETLVQEILDATVQPLRVSSLESCTPQETLQAQVPMAVQVADTLPVQEAPHARLPILHVQVQEDCPVSEACVAYLPVLLVQVTEDALPQETLAATVNPLTCEITEGLRLVPAPMGFPFSVSSVLEMVRASLPLAVQVADSALPEEAFGSWLPLQVSVTEDIPVAEWIEPTVHPLWVQVQDACPVQEALAFDTNVWNLVLVDTATPLEHLRVTLSSPMVIDDPVGGSGVGAIIGTADAVIAGWAQGPVQATPEPGAVAGSPVWASITGTGQTAIQGSHDATIGSTSAPWDPIHGSDWAPITGELA